MMYLKKKKKKLVINDVKTSTKNHSKFVKNFLFINQARKNGPITITIATITKKVTKFKNVFGTPMIITQITLKGRVSINQWAIYSKRLWHASIATEFSRQSRTEKKAKNNTLFLFFFSTSTGSRFPGSLTTKTTTQQL